MNTFDYPTYTTANGYLTESIRRKYIESAIKQGLLPENAHRMPHIVSLVASNNPDTPIQFWQLYSVLGPQRIVNLVNRFYVRVYRDEEWFTSVFARISSKDHHVQTQSSMWIDAMGGGLYYHGGEFRLSFHHTHNAFDLMNTRGAARWIELMKETLDDSTLDLTDDPRVRPALNTFLLFFLQKYASEFNFDYAWVLGDTNPPLKRAINLLYLSTDEIQALPEEDLINVLVKRGIDVSQYESKDELVNIALRL